MPLAAFAHQPTDVRSARVAVVNMAGDPASTVMAYRALGAPVFFVCGEGQMQWWRQGIGNPQYLGTLTISDLPRFFQEHRQDFAPHTIYRAKTRGRFENGYQLSFVDVGLMPLVEGAMGQVLSDLVEHVILDIRNHLKPPTITASLSRWLFQPASASGQYLRQRLHGSDIDDFAIEIARLSLTLADIPNPDGWDVRQADMFMSDTLECLTDRVMIFLANPPFENFSQTDRNQYVHQGIAYAYLNKTAELLHRTLPYLRPGAVFGVVIPQGLLQSKNTSDLRAFLVREFEVAEICLFPDKIFTFSDMESAILLGRKLAQSGKVVGKVRYRRVRESDAERFKQSYTATIERWIPQTQFIASANTSLYVPDLEEVWEWCRHFPLLAQLVEIGKGLEYKGKDLPTGAQTLSPFPFPGAVRGFARMTKNLRIDRQPPEIWMSIDPTVIRRPGTGTTTSVPQVLLNYAPVSRSPWRLKAIMDGEGHGVTSRFLTLRPLIKTCPLEFIWGLCNAPFANAYVYTHTGKRDVLTGMMRAMPIPHVSDSEVQRVVEVVHTYCEAVAPAAREGLTPVFDPNVACRLLQHPVTSQELGIQENDLWIAAQALEYNLVLVTNDKMDRMRDVGKDLQVANWAG